LWGDVIARYVHTMPKISAAAAAVRRSHLLDAARQCFAEHGIHVSVDQICAKAGVSKGAFYVYFSSKDAAIEALIEDHARVISACTDLGSAEALIEKLAALTIRRSVASTRVELETWTHSLRLPTMRVAFQRNLDGLREALASSINGFSHTTAGERRPPPPIAADILTSFSLGLIAASALGAERDPRSAEAALRALVKALVIETPAASQRPSGARRRKR
jgi:AcrR family transcriptional regulator